MAEAPKDPQIPLKGPPPGEYVDPVEALTTELMSATKRGDRAAYDRLVESLGRRAFTVARSLVGSHEDAQEMCQEAFLKTYRARETFREGEAFLPWFHRILRNTCFSFLRKRGRLKRQSLSGGAREEREDQGDWELVGDEPAPTEGPERDEAAQAFWEGFRQLSARDREILSLRHFEDLSYKQIATALEIPEGTVMSRLFHARRRLRDQLGRFLEGALADYANVEGDVE